MGGKNAMTKYICKACGHENEPEPVPQYNNCISLPWAPHEGEPRMNPRLALEIYRARQSDALSRTVMTDEQRENYVGDSKAST
jgi:hypothetical protein